jgi:hypothetical protein
MTKVNGTKYDEIRNKISHLTDLMVSIGKDWEQLSEEDKERLAKTYTLDRGFGQVIDEFAEWEGNLYDDEQD